MERTTRTWLDRSITRFWLAKTLKTDELISGEINYLNSLGTHQNQSFIEKDLSTQTTIAPKFFE